MISQICCIFRRERRSLTLQPYILASLLRDPNHALDPLSPQVYVRQRLAELAARMPPRMGTRERAELAFLEEKVVHDHIPMKRRRLRDPLRDVDERQIKQTNLVRALTLALSLQERCVCVWTSGL